VTDFHPYGWVVLGTDRELSHATCSLVASKTILAFRGESPPTRTLRPNLANVRLADHRLRCCQVDAIDMLESPSMTDVRTNPPAKSSAPLMALAGLISAVLISPIWILYPLIGPLWGLALVVYFFAYEKNRNPIALLLFLFVSGGAFVASLKIASLLANGGSLYGMGAPYMSLPSLPFLFTAGSAGAVIVLATGVFAFGCAGFRWKTIGNILVGSVGGGLLAVVAGLAGNTMPFEARSKIIDFGYALVFLLWQPGVAAILGLTLNADRKSALSSGAIPQRGVSGSRQIAIGIVAGLCILCVVAFQTEI